MTKSNGIASLKQAAKLLNRHAPDGESLAYINPDEAKLLRSRGSSGIMTVAGVPSYFLDKLWEGAKALGKSFLGRYKDQPAVYDEGKLIERAQSGFGNLAQDALSVWGALRAKKEQEGLNAAEMEQFNKLNQQMLEDTAEFKSFSDAGSQLTAPEYITDETKVAAYKPITFNGQDTPDLTIDAKAYGGRIGYDEGAHPLDADAIAIFGNPYNSLNAWQQTVVNNSKAQGGRIGYNLGGIDRPFQGIGALNRMGYQVGSSDIPGIPGVGKAMRDQNYLATDIQEDVSTTGEVENLLKGTRVQEDVSTTGGNQIQETVMTLINSGIVGDTREALEHAHILNEYEINSPGVTKLALSLINSHIVGDVREAIEQALTIMRASQAQGGRIGAQGGGIMPLLDMGGMEKDYRQDGGFVPIGRREKADDVPARLSKNEFVFTADAVKAAGGGDIDQGAQRMYNVMKNLEAGGEISKQSQGQG